jgi:lipopolysaccharide/colanic/teichoic acid biosynthesis glycosyltransferase
VKRLFDLLFSFVGLILLAPLFLLVAVWITLDSKGPVFFKHLRVGKGFTPFALYKFRTMVDRAADRGPPITVDGDSRITRAGRLLRRYKIDELPQLINVFRGEMSLVGPRPEVSRYVQMYREHYADILAVHPGITDFASIKYRSESALLAQAEEPSKYYVEVILPDKIQLAKEYARSASLSLDLRLILLTLAHLMLPGDGSRPRIPAQSPAQGTPHADVQRSAARHESPNGVSPDQARA